MDRFSLYVIEFKSNKNINLKRYPGAAFVREYLKLQGMFIRISNDCKEVGMLAG